MKFPAFFLVFCVAAFFFASPAKAQNESLALFRNLPSDRPPEEITKNSHYWISNETRLDLFHDSVKDRGGVYIGVGSDQNYLMAGWAKSEVLVLMDFDQKIVDLHRVYNVAFREAANKEEFIALWQESSSKKLRDLVSQHYPDKKTQKAALQAHQAARRIIGIRFRKVIKLMTEAKLPSFLTDDAQYQYVRSLILNDKVFMVAGDMTAKITMRAIGKAIAGAGLRVGVLYLSNAEQYFGLRSTFQENIHSLPSDDKSLVVRTNGWRHLSWVNKTEYHYNVQALDNFKLFLSKNAPRTTGRMLQQATPGVVEGFSVSDTAPLSRAAWKKSRRNNRVSQAVVDQRTQLLRERSARRERQIAERKAKRAKARGE